MTVNFADEQAQDIREQAAAHTLAANPLVGVRGEDFVASARLLLGETLNNPAVSMRQYVALLAELGRIATGGSGLAPDPKDRRFADPAWKDNAAYRALAQSYLAWAMRCTAFSTRPRSTAAMPNARVSWSRCWWMRSLPPIGSPAIRRH